MKEKLQFVKKRTINQDMCYTFFTKIAMAPTGAGVKIKRRRKNGKLIGKSLGSDFRQPGSQ